jgi:two-component system CAI-1 autoinducer sensor kinase/phosphatase CqsS
MDSNINQEQPQSADVWSSITSENTLDLHIINELKDIGGDELIISLFETFTEDADKLMAELAEAVARKEMTQFDHVIHTLKGSSGSIGANKMYVLCRYLNDFSRKGRWPDDSSWMEVLKNVYDETSRVLRNHSLISQHSS